MLKTLMIATLVAITAAPALAVQTTVVEQKPVPAAAAPKEIPPARPAPPPPPSANVRIDVSISDQTGNGTPAKKVVSMIAGDRHNANIRSNASVPVKNVSGGFNYRSVTINIDAIPTISLKDPNKVIVNIGIEYLPSAAGASEGMEAGMASLSERLNGLILDSGKPMVISQAADPTSDRRVTVEITATILK